MSVVTAPGGFGRLDARDERDLQYGMRAYMVGMPVVPDRTHRTWYAPTALNQGQTSSCVGHAWKHWLLSSPFPNNSGPGQFVIYEEAQKNDEWPGEAYAGTSVRAGAQVLQKAGLVETYVWGKSAAEIGDFVLSKSPVVMGTIWKRGMNTPGKHGLVIPDGPNEGGHAYLCIGYNRVRGVFRFLNSWGVGWGEQGRFSMLGEHLDRLIAEDRWADACSAVELRAAPIVA